MSPLYGESRDISFFEHINEELLTRIIEQKIGFYKISLENTKSNIYGESSEKIYLDPVLLNCLITRGDQATLDNEFGPDRSRSPLFAFLKQHLIDITLVPEIGDIIEWNGNYYEIDGLVENQLIVGKAPEYPYDQPYLSRFGNSLSIICSTHWTRVDKLNIKKSR